MIVLSVSIGNMVIYKVTNRINGKMYIGQTTSTIKKRWTNHIWNSKRGSKSAFDTALARALRFYGKESFDIEIIDTATSLEELNIKEWYFASMLNTYAPYGYNLAECGWGYKKHIDSVKKRCKMWRFTSPEGEEVIVDHLSVFCDRMNLLISCMTQVGNDQKKSHKGWRRTGRPIVKYKRKHTEETVKKISGDDIKRLLNNSDMKIYEFINTTRFCTQMGLQRALIINVLKGSKRSKHKRWSLVENPIKRFLIKHMDGREVEVFDGELKAFCRENEIKSPKGFFEMLNGKLLQCKGWSLIRAYYPDTNNLEVLKLKQYNMDRSDS